MGVLIAYFFANFLNYPLDKRLLFFLLAGVSLIISIHFMTYLFIRDREQQVDSKLGRQVAFACDILFTFVLFSFQSIELQGYLRVIWTISYLVCMSSFFIAIYFCVYWITNGLEHYFRKK